VFSLTGAANYGRSRRPVLIEKSWLQWNHRRITVLMLKVGPARAKTLPFTGCCPPSTTQRRMRQASLHVRKSG